MKKAAIRLSVPVSPKNYLWLQEESEKSGMSYASLIAFALDSYISQKKAVDVLGTLMKKVEVLEAKGEEKNV